MTVTGRPEVSLLQSVLDASQARQDMGVEVLRKAQDTTRQQGEAMVQLLEQAAVPADPGRFDAYA